MLGFAVNCELVTHSSYYTTAYVTETYATKKGKPERLI